MSVPGFICDGTPDPQGALRVERHATIKSPNKKLYGCQKNLYNGQKSRFT